MDSSSYRLTDYEGDIADMGPKAQGDYGQGVAENYSHAQGIDVEREVYFPGDDYNVRVDPYDRSTVSRMRSRQGALGFLS